MIYPNIDHQDVKTNNGFQKKLWVYTNYDCNLSCSYCLAESSPKCTRHPIGVAQVKQLVDEALVLGFTSVYFTGGEPFLRADIYEMLSYAFQRMPTTVLTNAMLFKGKRLESLCAIQNNNLTIQISLDGGCPEHHDPYRGKGSWVKTVEGLKNVLDRGFRVQLSTTETQNNTSHIKDICDFHLSLGIAEENHFIRPLARRGFSKEGLEVRKATLLPEITVSQDGVYWHPLSTDLDMRVRDQIFPLSESVNCLQAELEMMTKTDLAELNEFH